MAGYSKSTKKQASSKENAGLSILKEDLKQGAFKNAYIFCGEEAFLRAEYLNRLQKTVLQEGDEEFNFHRLNGKNLDIMELEDAVEAFPMMAEHTMVIVDDLDIFGQQFGESNRNALIRILEDVPEYCCLVLNYDAIPYKSNSTMKKLCEAIKHKVQVVSFEELGGNELSDHIIRIARASQKEISRADAEYLVFVSGTSLNDLHREMEKLCAYANGSIISQKDIDAVATRQISAIAFELTDSVLKNDYNKAAGILGALFAQHESPVMILAALSSQLRKIYTARLALDGGKGIDWLKDLWDMKEYPAKLALQAARNADLRWCSDALRRCQILDFRMKGESQFDSESGLMMLLAELGASRK